MKIKKLKDFLNELSHPKINPESAAFNDASLKKMKIEKELEKEKKDKRDLTFDENKKITKTQEIHHIKMIRTYVGYWATYDELWYGNPVPNWDGWKDKELYNTFVNKLDEKLKTSRKVGYKGFSQCRICGKHNGCMEYLIDEKRVGDIITITVIPQGYMHYIEDHKIEPHKWFLKYIINFQALA